MAKHIPGVVQRRKRQNPTVEAPVASSITHKDALVPGTSPQLSQQSEYDPTVMPSGNWPAVSNEQPETASQSASPAQDALPQARVLIEFDGKACGEILLNKALMTVGRMPGSDIYIANKQVSRQHARMHVERDEWVIEDNASLNGLVHQGKRIKRLVLRHGDRLFLAPGVSLYYEILDSKSV